MDPRERSNEAAMAGEAQPAEARVTEATTEAVRDGRSERGARNRRAILDAVHRLIERDERMPTAERAADAAGVGIRTVFRHFSDMDALYSEVYQRVYDDLRDITGAPQPEGSLDERCRSVIERRCELFERMAAFRRASVMHHDKSEFLQRQVDANNEALRVRLLSVFPELEGAPPALVEALDLLSSFEAWNRLKMQQGLSNFEVRVALETAFVSLMREAIQ